MASNPDQLHILFFPHNSLGHLIPTFDLARSFCAHRVKSTVITTPFNASLFAESIHRDQQNGMDITLRTIDFPSSETQLPKGCQNLNNVASAQMALTYYNHIKLLQQPLAELLEEYRPSCLVADVMFPWATEVAKRFEIPRLIFHGTSLFAICAYYSVRTHEPHRSVVSDNEPFLLPGLPDKVEMTRLQLPNYVRERVENEMTKMIDESVEAEETSYGVVANSFYELEPAYFQHYRNVLGRRVWQVGPVSVCNRGVEDRAHRGGKSSIAVDDCLKWLDSKNPNSVIFLCFGSMFKFSASQLQEALMGLEDSGQYFILVVNQSCEEKRPEELNFKGKGLIVRGWAPQVLILEHEAIGGFVTHCGWNSTLEAVAAGKPMVTWPLFAEQFFNEKLVTDVLKIGVPVGARECSRWNSERKYLVRREEIKAAVIRVLVGEEGEAIRGRATMLGEMARKAVEIGGSSYSNIEALLEDIRSRKQTQLRSTAMEV